MSTQSKHTPGPWWFAQHDEFGRYDIGQGDSVIVRTIAPSDSGPGSAPITEYRHEHQHANARLIAAAPDLLAALESAAESIEQFVRIGRIPANNAGLQDARAAIAAARGEG